MTSSAAVELAARVPLYGAFGISGSAGEVYELQSELSGFGWYQKIEPPDWNYINGINNLSEEIRNALLTAINNNPENIILYVNKMYVIKRAHFAKNKGIKLASNMQVDVGSVVTSSGAFTFEDDRAETKTFNDLIINIDGIQLDISLTSEPSQTPQLRIFSLGRIPQPLTLNMRIKESVLLHRDVM